MFGSKKSYSQNGQVSKNFNRSEFACKCGCGFDSVDPELVYVAQDLRDHFNSPVTINSGCRCKKHNKKVGGSKGSKHLEGIAADIVVEGIPPIVVYSYLQAEYVGKYGLGKYPYWVHIDVRANEASW